MLAEFWRYWTTFAPERVRRHGYLSRLIALEFRARRCRAAWAPHLARCQDFIRTAARLAPRRDVAVIVGSGLLLEVPLEDLARDFARVFLIDMFHMPAVRRRVRRFENVTLLTGDVTGVFAAIKDGRAPGPHQPAPPAKIPHLTEADLAVSCNCLTQLAGPFVAQLERTPGFSDLDADRIAYQIMAHHAEAFAKRAHGVSAIITDIERHIMAGVHTIERIDLLKALKLPPTPTHTHNEEWNWRIAPRGEEDPKHDIEHIVAGRIYEHAPQSSASSDPEVAADARPLSDAPAGKFSAA